MRGEGGKSAMQTDRVEEVMCSGGFNSVKGNDKTKCRRGEGRETRAPDLSWSLSGCWETGRAERHKI